MPAFDLRNITVAEYQKTDGAATYGTPMLVGDSMKADLALKYAEGRLFAESSLSEYLKKATGGTISLAVKYILDEAKKLLYGAVAGSRTVGTATIKTLTYNKLHNGKYVGVAFYAPDMIDGVEKYTCVFVSKAMFGPPAMSYETMGDSIKFQTPTTTGEFLPNAAGDLLETGTADTEADAINWCKVVFGATVS